MYKKIVEGKGGITAKVVAKSCSESNPESVICTFELEYPRFIHSEIMTHRLFSRNAMSSRAVPISKMIEQVRETPATPIHWGANQAGMQAENQVGDIDVATSLWFDAANDAAKWVKRLNVQGLHKQITNRLLEPFQMMKTVLTATEFDNFFWLRCHSDAQPEIKELADCMYKAYQETEAEVLKVGEWHTPYVQHFKASDGDALLEYHVDNIGVSLEEALKVSSSCCAQVSYRLLDNSLEKALKVYDRLVESAPVHASPFEHQASPMSKTGYCIGEEFEDFFLRSGMANEATHVDSDGYAWSGNFKGWVQYRQMIPNNACWDYKAN